MLFFSTILVPEGYEVRTWLRRRRDLRQARYEEALRGALLASQLELRLLRGDYLPDVAQGPQRTPDGTPASLPPATASMASTAHSVAFSAYRASMAPTAAAVVDVPVVVTEAVYDYLMTNVIAVNDEGCWKAIDGSRYIRVGPATVDLRRGLFEYSVRQLLPGEVLRRTCSAALGCVAPGHRVVESRSAWGRRLGGGQWRTRSE